MRYRLIVLSAGLTLPALYVHLRGSELSPPRQAATFGMGVLAAAFLLAWSIEVLQLDLSRGVALALLAIVAILPEYAVDLYFAWTAAEQPEMRSLALANMTGANRLLVGLGVPLVMLLLRLLRGRSGVRLGGTATSEAAYLGVAATYALLVPLTGGLSLFDAVVLASLYGLYVWRISHAPRGEPDLIGPAATLARLPTMRRRTVVAGLLLYAAGVILVSAEPFATALIDSGRALGVEEFLLVQWVAPLASESPELLVAALWTARGEARMGLAALISSELTQWTLLVASIPAAYSLHLGHMAPLPLGPVQSEEIWLTATQALFAVAVFASQSVGAAEAGLLFALYAVQLVVPGFRVAAALAYAALAIVWLSRTGHGLLPFLRRGLAGSAR